MEKYSAVQSFFGERVMNFKIVVGVNERPFASQRHSHTLGRVFFHVQGCGSFVRSQNTSAMHDKSFLAFRMFMKYQLFIL